jgi:hypothetical protein
MRKRLKLSENGKSVLFKFKDIRGVIDLLKILQEQEIDYGVYFGNYWVEVFVETEKG